ncbi:hypothetical protein GDO78_014473 [Eleutherodactylus coqui]|uniref:Uncharacterized protein n=1 Tax=Eleutherodactylus coqui TaxID=57060 RepID=A0A8J6EC09_ELECQ|nr:hypothetical protein GDO78_014473 [Eleutherodactylus coqui]
MTIRRDTQSPTPGKWSSGPGFGYNHLQPHLIHPIGCLIYQSVCLSVLSLVSFYYGFSQLLLLPILLLNHHIHVIQHEAAR